MTDVPSNDPIAIFWSRYARTRGRYPTGALHVARLRAKCDLALPETFVTWLTRARVTEIAAPGLAVGDVDDWLAYAIDRHAVMRTLADVHGNPLLAMMVPFGDTAHGYEVALCIDGNAASVVWLDPARWDADADAVRERVAASVDEYLAQHVG